MTETSTHPYAIPPVHAVCFRSVRAVNRISNWIGSLHHEQFAGFVKIMRLGLPVLADRTLDVEAVTETDRRGGWCCLGKGLGHLADKIGFPVNMREGSPPFTGPDTRPIVGHVAAGVDRDGDLWGLCCWLEPGESEVAASFRERCAEALQVHGVVPVQVAA